MQQVIPIRSTLSHERPADPLAESQAELLRHLRMTTTLLRLPDLAARLAPAERDMVDEARAVIERAIAARAEAGLPPAVPA